MDMGAGTFVESTFPSPNCPHWAEIYYLLETRGMGSGSLTAKCVAEVYDGVTIALSTFYWEIAPITITFSKRPWEEKRTW